MRLFMTLLSMVVVGMVAFTVGQLTAQSAHEEAASFYQVQTLQKGYQAGLRDGARCMAHRNCFTISSDLSRFAKSLKRK